MKEQDRSPITAGFLFGLGFWTAGAILSAIASVVVWMAITHSIQVTTPLDRVPPPPKPSGFTTYETPPAERPVVVVPPRSVEACKELTHGQINEDFARCRRGYRETR